MNNNKDSLIINNRQFDSRLLVGTGKFSSLELMRDSLIQSCTEIVTVSLRRMDYEKTTENILDFIEQKQYLILPNTSGAKNAEEAVRLAKIAKASGISDWIKLEITPEPRYLLPDPVETLKAAEILVKEKFVVLPYINADPVLAKRLEEAGCATVMPLGSPIGTNKGIKTLELLKIIIEQANVPVVVDAGLGAPSHASLAMELGADAVLVNTAIAVAEKPLLMAEAFKLSVEAGRRGYLAGIPEIKSYAEASSPLTGFLDS